MRCSLHLLLAAFAFDPVKSSWTLESGARIAGSSRNMLAASSAAPVSILDLPLAEQWANDAGLSARHLLNVYRHLFRRGGEFTPAAIHNDAELPKAAALAMCDAFASSTSKVVQRVPSEGGLKLVVELASGHRVETVLILHEHRSSGRRRCTVCVSSQVGCARACSFCATGTMGLRAQLSSGEILEQVWHARRELEGQVVVGGQSNGQGGDERTTAAAAAAAGGVAGAGAGGGSYEVRNIVFMGMGEPLDNFDALHDALRGLTHQGLFDLSAKHITVSTVGASPERIRRLADEAPRVRLALSLHGASQPLREELIPSAASCQLPELCAALDYHARTTRCGLMVEYLLIAGVNDRLVDADELAAFCAAREVEATRVEATRVEATRVAAEAAGAAGAVGKRAKWTAGYVNLIPFNPTEAGSLHGYQTPSDESVEAFHSRLREHDVNALVRWSSATGRDANGACGQLVV